jgi:hypothetical protein
VAAGLERMHPSSREQERLSIVGLGPVGITRMGIRGNPAEPADVPMLRSRVGRDRAQERELGSCSQALFPAGTGEKQRFGKVHRPLTRPPAEGIMMSMRTTLTLDDDVLKAAKRRAREQDRSLKDVINEALRHGLALSDAHRRPSAYAFRLKTVAGRLLPGVDLADRDKLFELMERG